MMYSAQREREGGGCFKDCPEDVLINSVLRWLIVSIKADLRRMNGRTHQ